MHILDGRFAAYLLVSALLIVVPGPDMALVTRNALSSGVRGATFTALGVALGIFAWAMASAGGVAVLIARSVLAFTVLKLAGAAYLGVLGLRNLLGSSGTRAEASVSIATSPPGPWGALRQGALGNLLNPKAAVIFISILPQFVRPGDSPLRLIAMLVAFEAMLLGWLIVYGLLVSLAGRSRFGATADQVLKRATGFVLIGLGVRLAIERR